MDVINARARRAKYRLSARGQEMQRRASLRYLYNTTPEEVDVLLAKQDGCCALCGVKLVDYHIDHDHVTGTIRGLLCGVHNQGLGFFQESPELLRKAASYLESFNGHGA